MKQVNRLSLYFGLMLLFGADMSFGQTKPNILLLMAEDMSLKVGAFGDDVAVTPNLDKLAQQAVRYPNTFTAAGVCAPSRTAHITGMHQISVGGQHMRARDFTESKYKAVPSAEVKAYPELLRKAGYYTFTNFKLDYQFSGIKPGTGPFTIWDYEGREPDWNRRSSGQPFFGFINFNESHESQLFPKNVKKNHKLSDWEDVVTPDQVTVPPYYPDTAAVRKDIAQHYNNIHLMDKRVGQLLAKLKEDGLADNTIIIWTTDHGDCLPRGKREIYDSGIKVPMIVYWPDSLRPDNAQPGTVNNRLVSFVDFGATILTLAEEEIPTYMHGKPQFGVAAGEPRQYIYASKDRLDGLSFRERAVRDSRFKYLRNYMPGKPGGQHIKYRDGLGIMQDLWASLEQGSMNAAQRFWFEPRPAEELYDIVSDPHEVNNLAADPQYAGELQRMRGALSEWQKRVTDLSDMPELEMAKKFWPQGVQPVTPVPTISVDDSGLIALKSEIEGASIGYRIGDGEWQLYKGPLSLGSGIRLTAKAVRYGWMESAEVVYSD